MGVWISGRAMEQARYGAASAVIEDKIYCSGGAAAFIGSTLTARNTMEVYDGGRDTWTMLEMPYSIAYHSMVAFDNRLYLMGGTVGPNAPVGLVWIYDTVTGVWSEGKGMAVPSMVFTARCVDGKIYCMGGRATNAITEESVLFQIYDIATNQWESRTLPRNCANAVSAVTAGKIYLFSGATTAGTVKGYVAIYNPQTDSWSEGADMLNPRGAGATATEGELIYILNGTPTGSSFDCVAVMDVYNTGTNLWSPLGNTPYRAARPCSESINGRIHLFGGGYAGTSPVIHNRLDIYIPEDILTVTCRYLDQNSRELLPDSVTEVVPGTSFAADAPAVSRHTFVGSQVDDSETLLQTTVTMDRVLRSHIVTFLYKADGVTTPGSENSCECGSLEVRLKLPVCNNTETLGELTRLMAVIKGCDCSCDE